MPTRNQSELAAAWEAATFKRHDEMMDGIRVPLMISGTLQNWHHACSHLCTDSSNKLMQLREQPLGRALLFRGLEVLERKHSAQVSKVVP